MTTKKRTGLQAPTPIFTLSKAQAALTDADGMFTALAAEKLTAYANAWLKGARDLVLERQYAELAGSFYDIRVDSDYARRWADDDALVVEKVTQKVGLSLAKSLDEMILKAGLPAPKTGLPKFVIPT